MRVIECDTCGYFYKEEETTCPRCAKMRYKLGDDVCDWMIAVAIKAAEKSTLDHSCGYVHERSMW